MVKEHKDSKQEETLKLSKHEFKNVLEYCGVSGERVDKFCDKFDEQFGKNAEIVPKSICDVKKFEVQTPDVTIKVNPDKTELVSTQIINGVKYIMIRANDGVVVNGMSRYARNGRNANSAICVQINREDYGSDPRAAIEFQRELERRAFTVAGSSYAAPVQTLGDFYEGKASNEPSRIMPTYMDGNVKVCDITTVLPEKASITVDQIRAVRSEAYIVPNQSAKRVFIIPDAALMNIQAQNALLKVLEEPPATVMFILTCEYTRQLLGTVVSRSAVLSLSPPEQEDAERYIAKNYPQYSADEIADACTGTTIGGALAALSGVKRYINEAVAAIEALLTGELELHKFMHAFEKNRDAQKGICTAMGEIFHAALRVRQGGKCNMPVCSAVESLSRRYTSEQLLRMCEVCERGVADSEANMGGAVFVTVLCASLSEAKE